MDIILIVDDNQDILETLREGLRLYKSQFHMMMASNGADAIRLLNENKISLVVTDLMMPKIGGLKLIAYMTKNFPSVPCIVMSRFDPAKSKEILPWDGALRCIEKPFKIQQIASAIIEGLDLLDEGITKKGIALSSFMPLVEVDRTSCFLKVKYGETDSGLLYFIDGTLFDASYKKLEPVEAATAMLAWEGVEISFLQMPEKKYERRIFSDLGSLISEARQIIEKNAQIAEFSMSGKEPSIPEAFIAPDLKGNHKDMISCEDVDSDIVEEELFVEIKPGCQDMVNSKLSGLADLKGFKAAVVISPGGEIVAGKYENFLSFEKIGDLVFDIVRKAHKCSEFLDFKPFETIDMATGAEEHFLIRGHSEHHIRYLLVMICSGEFERQSAIERLGHTASELIEYLKTR